MKKFILISSKQNKRALESWLQSSFPGCDVTFAKTRQEATRYMRVIDADLILTSPESFVEERPVEIPSQFEIVSHTHHGIQRVALEDIYYFKADQKYVLVIHRHGDLLLEGVLNKLEKQYEKWFIRAHRSILVKRSQIASIFRADDGGHYIRLKDKPDVLPVSRRQLSSIRKALLAAG